MSFQSLQCRGITDTYRVCTKVVESDSFGEVLQTFGGMDELMSPQTEEVIDDVVTSEELQEEIAEEMNQQAYDEEDIPVEESADVEEVEE